jgi:hypothetical protein
MSYFLKKGSAQGICCVTMLVVTQMGDRKPTRPVRRFEFAKAIRRSIVADKQDALLITALDLVGKAYEAAADGSWSHFLNAMADATGSEGTVLWLHNAADTSARFEDAQTSRSCAMYGWRRNS